MTSVCIAGTRRRRRAAGRRRLGPPEARRGLQGEDRRAGREEEPATARATPVESTAASPRASGGPTTHVNSTAEVSTA